MKNEKKKLVPEETKPKYQPPQAIIIKDLKNGIGSCSPGAGDATTCDLGSSASSNCVTGPIADDWCNIGIAGPV